MNNSDTVMRQILNNNLNGQDYDFVIAQLCVLNNKPYNLMLNKIEKLIKNGSAIVNKENILTIKNITQGLNGSKIKKNINKNGNVVIDGKIQGTKRSFAFFIPFDSDYEDVYIHGSNLYGALNGDTVTVEIQNGKKGLEGRVIKVLERGNDNIIGKITFTKNSGFVMSDDVRFNKDIYVAKNNSLNAKEGDKVVVKINKYFYDKKNPEGEVIEVLGQPNNIETEVLSVIRSYKLYEHFPDKVKEQAKNVPDEVSASQLKNRLDLTNELIFTIDGEDAKDFDDAVSLTEDNNGQQVLGIHIADVGEYVKLNSEIDNEAFKRGTSAYFPGLVLPMLPKSLSNGICSLNELVNRLTLSVFITYDNNARVVDYKIYESVIKSKKRFTYTEVDKVLQNDPDALKRNKDFSETLHKMNILAKKLSGVRKARGEIDFDIPEVKISLNEMGDILNVQKRERNDSHKLIESFMIAANEAIAYHFNKNKIPFVYRVHEKPEPEKISKFLNFIKSLGIVQQNYINCDNVKAKDIQQIIGQLQDSDIKYVVNRVCLRSLKKAKYSPDCLGHFGLASLYYCHFTSPIRRYPDLTIHRIIKKYIRNELTGSYISNTKHFVRTSSQVSSEREVLAQHAERDVDDLYKAYYMQFHLGEEFEGKISGVTAFGLYVELENTVEGLVRLEDLPADNYSYYEDTIMLKGVINSFKMGDKIKVKAIRADILAREVDFILS